jgi:hypothetical protein
MMNNDDSSEAANTSFLESSNVKRAYSRLCGNKRQGTVSSLTWKAASACPV